MTSAHQSVLVVLVFASCWLMEQHFSVEMRGGGEHVHVVLIVQ